MSTTYTTNPTETTAHFKRLVTGFAALHGLNLRSLSKKCGFSPAVFNHAFSGRQPISNYSWESVIKNAGFSNKEIAELKVSMEATNKEIIERVNKERLSALINQNKLNQPTVVATPSPSNSVSRDVVFNYIQANLNTFSDREIHALYAVMKSFK